MTLCRGQGGTPAETVTRPRADTWQLVDMCHEAGCVLTRVELFRADTWPDYSRVGYRGLGKGFHVSGAVVHTMRRRSARPGDAGDPPAAAPARRPFGDGRVDLGMLLPWPVDLLLKILFFAGSFWFFARDCGLDI